MTPEQSPNISEQDGPSKRIEALIMFLDAEIGFRAYECRADLSEGYLRQQEPRGAASFQFLPGENYGSPNSNELIGSGPFFEKVRDSLSAIPVSFEQRELALTKLACDALGVSCSDRVRERDVAGYLRHLSSFGLVAPVSPLLEAAATKQWLEFVRQGGAHSSDLIPVISPWLPRGFESSSDLHQAVTQKFDAIVESLRQTLPLTGDRGCELSHFASGPALAPALSSMGPISERLEPNAYEALRLGARPEYVRTALINFHIGIDLQKVATAVKHSLTQYCRADQSEFVAFVKEHVNVFGAHCIADAVRENNDIESVCRAVLSKADGDEIPRVLADLYPLAAALGGDLLGDCRDTTRTFASQALKEQKLPRLAKLLLVQAQHDSEASLLNNLDTFREIDEAVAVLAKPQLARGFLYAAMTFLPGELGWAALARDTAAAERIADDRRDREPKVRAIEALLDRLAEPAKVGQALIQLGEDYRKLSGLFESVASQSVTAQTFYLNLCQCLTSGSSFRVVQEGVPLEVAIRYSNFVLGTVRNPEAGSVRADFERDRYALTHAVWLTEEWPDDKRSDDLISRARRIMAAVGIEGYSVPIGAIAGTGLVCAAEGRYDLAVEIYEFLRGGIGEIGVNPASISELSLWLNLNSRLFAEGLLENKVELLVGLSAEAKTVAAEVDKRADGMEQLARLEVLMQSVALAELVDPQHFQQAAQEFEALVLEIKTELRVVTEIRRFGALARRAKLEKSAGVIDAVLKA